ncbi:MAG: VWA domain-containing protein [Calditrichae bacterium]|nr:VWA domain-containing protein [Calditrichia bacterium]
MKSVLAMVILAVLLALLPGCEDVVYRGYEEDSTPTGSGNTAGEDEFLLYLNYWNPDGNSPQIEFDSARTSAAVQVDTRLNSRYGQSGSGNTVRINLDNVSIADQQGCYEIQAIETEEFRGNAWHSTTEYVAYHEPVSAPAVVLALDVSASLGADFQRVKTHAKAFVRRVKILAPGAAIGIVDFAGEVHQLAPTADTSAVLAYIDGLLQGQFTALYAGMDAGITLLANSAGEGKALVTFTDGNDNNSPSHLTPAYLKERLESPDPGGRHIKSFTIGLQGRDGVDPEVLTALTSETGLAAFPETVGELGKVFEHFSRAVALSYHLTYVRNRQPIPENEKRAVRLRIAAAAR